MSVETAEQLEILLRHRSSLTSFLTRYGSNMPNILEGDHRQDHHQYRYADTQTQRRIEKEVQIRLRQIVVADRHRRIHFLDAHLDQHVKTEYRPHDRARTDGEVGESLGAVESCVDLLRRDEQAIDGGEDENNWIVGREKV